MFQLGTGFGEPLFSCQEAGGISVGQKRDALPEHRTACAERRREPKERIPRAELPTLHRILWKGSVSPA